METYRMDIKKTAIKYDKYKEIVYEKQVNNYGLDSAEKILKTASNIFTESVIQKNDPTKSNNVLLVGKVQSGKTSNLEMLSALAFDNGYNLLIIYGGYDNTLLRQCVDRFSKTFNVDEEYDYSPMLFSTENDLTLIDSQLIEDAFENKKPIILCALKRPKAINSINSLLKRLDCSIINSFIIDDEGDQASLNTNKKVFFDSEGNNDGSATYKAICEMKTLLSNPLYYAVTATPEANIFQPDISELVPNSIHLIRPADSYTGADVFHLNTNEHIKRITIDSIAFDEGRMDKSLEDAINYYLIASALMKIRGIDTSEMIIHAYREIEGHQKLYDIVKTYLDDIYLSIKNNNDEDIVFYSNKIKKIYSKEYFNKETLDKYDWELVLGIIKKIVSKGIKPIMKNSDGNVDQHILRHCNYKIYIGGDLLQRGITFDKLVCTYFIRWAKSGNMDTNLQRARWFGYREKYIDLCKVFTTAEIEAEFSNLGTIENDLWSQFSQVEAGEMNLNEIVIDSGDSSLNPTRKNVSVYKKAKFGKSWNNQMYIATSIDQINKNNSLLENLLNTCDLIETSAGRLDNNISAYYSMSNKNKFIDFINSYQYIFDQTPFNGKNSIYQALSQYDEVCLEFMYGDGLKDIRKRTFIGNKVLALQQGADTTDTTKQKYKGDAYVIVNNNVPCIQIFKVLPIIDDVERRDLIQYMFSMHFPVEHVGFIKK